MSVPTDAPVAAKRLRTTLLKSLAGGLMIVLLSGVLAVLQTKSLIDELRAEAGRYDKAERDVLFLQVRFKEQVQEWKNVLLRGNDAQLMEKHWRAFELKEREVQEKATALLPLLVSSAAKPKLQQFVVAHAQLSAEYRRALTQFDSNRNDPWAADALIRGIDRATANVIMEAGLIVSEESEAFGNIVAERGFTIAVTNFALIFAAVLFGIIPFTFSFDRNVSTPIGELSAFARRFANGERGQQLISRSQDEIGELVQAFNYASLELDKLVTDLEVSRGQYRDLLDGIDAIVWVFDPLTKRFSFVSESAATILGHPAAQWTSAENFLPTYIHPDDLERVTLLFATAVEEGSSELEHRAITSDQKIIWVQNRIRAVKDFTGHTQLLGVLMDITPLKDAEAQSEYLATHDKLTGLPNRQLLMRRLNGMLSTGSGTPVALMMLNIDRFKTINESLGHKGGDLVIKRIASRLTAQVQAHPHATVARLGGDEFAIALSAMECPESIALFAKDILENVGHPLLIEGHRLALTCTIGIALYPNDGTLYEELLKNAGVALSVAKAQGRNRYNFYTEEANAKALERLTIENALRNAVEQKELLLHYQPQVDIEMRAIIGAEALVRWQSPQLGLVAPGDFIPLAEETGAILNIGDWVLREACQQAKRWIDQGHENFCISVNVSALQFTQPDFVERVAAALAVAKLDPKHLEIEITESAVMHDVESIIRTLHALKSLGVTLAIDDFGTGYSSLSYLKRFPIDKLKIDRSFVNDIATDSSGEAIVSTIVALAKNLGLRVIAEGVETEQQLAYLQSLHCEEAQGYYFGRPVDAASLLRVLATPVAVSAV